VELSLTLNGAKNILTNGKTCQGRTGYDDPQIGAAITVLDHSGTVIATSSIDDVEGVGSTCTLYGTVQNVPEVSFYQLHVGRRDVPSFSLAEM